MSHQTKIKTKIKSLKAAKQVAKELGFKILENQTWRTYGGMTNKVADIVLRHPDCSFDLALIKQSDDTYQMSADFWEKWGDKRHMAEIVGKNGGLFQRDVNAVALAEKAFNDGWMVEQTMLDNGIIDLECEMSEEQLLTLGYGGM